MQDSEKQNATGRDFEAKLAELEEIVKKLESDVSLEDGMALFQSGLDLTKECIADLNETQKSIDKLKGELDKIVGSSAE